MDELLRTDCEDYIRFHAQHAELEKKLKPLKEKILPLIEKGAVSPVDLPYLLVNRPQTRSQPDWKGLVLRLFCKLLGSKKRGQAEFERIDNGWPTKEVPSLCVEKNLAYAVKIGRPE